MWQKMTHFFQTCIHPLIQLTIFINEVIYLSWLRIKLIGLIEVTQLFNLIELIGLIDSLVSLKSQNSSTWLSLWGSSSSLSTWTDWAYENVSFFVTLTLILVGIVYNYD